MKKNAHAEKAQQLRNEIWDIIFSKIQIKEKDQPIPEDILWEKRATNPVVRSLLQIYYLMSERIEEASTKKDQSQIDTLGPLAYVMVPIAYGVT